MVRNLKNHLVYIFISIESYDAILKKTTTKKQYYMTTVLYLHFST